MRFFRWDFTTGLMTEYERVGECNGCGDCCRSDITITIAVNKIGETARDGGSGTTGRGVWHEVIDPAGGNRLYHIVIGDTHAKPCFFLANNLCQRHGQKVAICADWPMAPEHVTPFPNCSYSFSQISESAFEGLTLPREQEPAPINVIDVGESVEYRSKEVAP